MSQRVTGIGKPFNYHVVVKLEIDKPSDVIQLTPEAESLHKLGSAIGIIVGIGQSAFKEDAFGGLEAKVGDRVVFKRYAGQLIEIDSGPDKGDAYRFLRDIDIMGTIDKVDEEA